VIGQNIRRAQRLALAARQIGVFGPLQSAVCNLQLICNHVGDGGQEGEGVLSCETRPRDKAASVVSIPGCAHCTLQSTHCTLQGTH